MAILARMVARCLVATRLGTVGEEHGGTVEKAHLEKTSDRTCDHDPVENERGRASKHESDRARERFTEAGAKAQAAYRNRQSLGHGGN